MFATPLHEKSQTPLQLRVGCNLAQAVPQTLLGALREHVVVPQLVFAQPSYVAHRRTLRYPGQKPSEGLTQRCFFDPRLCDQLAEGLQGLDETPQPQACVRSGEHRAQEQRADILLCGWMVLVVVIAQYGYDALGSFAEHRTSWIVRFRGYLRNSALRFLEFQSKLLPFRSPVTGL
jgi:hypothetical protein